jgi:hypothetical protein
MNSINLILHNLLSKPQRKFLVTLFSTILVVCGKVNFNGSAGRAEKGLEISLLAIVDVDAKQGYALTVQQTQPAKATAETTRIDYYLEQLQVTYPYLPKSARYVVSDAFYSKIKWVNGVC